MLLSDRELLARLTTGGQRSGEQDAVEDAFCRRRCANGSDRPLVSRLNWIGRFQWVLFADCFVTVNHQRKMTSYHVEVQSEFDHKTGGIQLTATNKTGF